MVDLENRGLLDEVFKGTAAESFREYVIQSNFNENTYPFYAKGNKVLKTWRGPKFGIAPGNNLPANDVELKPRKGTKRKSQD